MPEDYIEPLYNSSSYYNYNSEMLRLICFDSIQIFKQELNVLQKDIMIYPKVLFYHLTSDFQVLLFHIIIVNYGKT